MTYQQLVNEVFTDHHDCMGMGSDEIADLIAESTHEQRERFLKRNGYDLADMWDLCNE